MNVLNCWWSLWWECVVCVSLQLQVFELLLLMLVGASHIESDLQLTTHVEEGQDDDA